VRRFETSVGLSAFALSLVVNYLLGKLSFLQGAQAYPAPDLMFRLLPLVDMRFFFVYGFGAFIALAIGAAVTTHRDRLGHIAWSFALLIAARSVFIILTPLRLPDEALPIVGYPIYDLIGTKLTFSHDLFFSSHTAMPYMAYLIYRGRALRSVFMAFSILMASTVLLSRLHYSIDVFAAYFIVYGLYRADQVFVQAPYEAWKKKKWAPSYSPSQPLPSL
jgi:hypothetical protein